MRKQTIGKVIQELGEGQTECAPILQPKFYGIILMISTLITIASEISKKYVIVFFFSSA